MGNQVFKTNIFNLRNTSVLLSLVLHVFFLLIIFYKVNFIYRYPNNESTTLTIELISNLKIDQSSLVTKKINASDEIKEEIISKSSSQNNITTLNSDTQQEPPLTSGWQSNQRIKRIESNPNNPKNNLLARMEIELSQRYSKIQTAINLAQERIFIEQTSIQCAIRFDEKLKIGHINCNSPFFSEMIKNYLSHIGISWINSQEEKLTICIPIAIRATGNGLCV